INPAPARPVCPVAHGLRGGSRSVLPRPTCRLGLGLRPSLWLTAAHTCAKTRLRMARGVRGGSFVSSGGLLVTLASTSHCGGRTWDPAIFEEAFPAQVASALCGGDGIDACCTAAGMRGKNADCVPTATAQFEKAAKAARAAGQLYDARAAAACVDE